MYELGLHAGKSLTTDFWFRKGIKPSKLWHVLVSWNTYSHMDELSDHH